jgi:hypothetical protein
LNKEGKTDVEAERKRKGKGESSLRERKNYEHTFSVIVYS